MFDADFDCMLVQNRAGGLYMTQKIRRTVIVGAVVLPALIVAGVALLAMGGPERESEHHEFYLEARSDTVNISDGVTFEGFTFDGTIPGPQKVVRQGDTVEIIVENTDSVAHGLSMHAIDGQTSNFLGNIEAGDTATLEFTADDPGVFMYHCAPGGHGIMAHTMGGQHGMFVVLPDEQYQMEQDLGREPDVEVFIVQHEAYSDGQDFFDGNAQYVMFNGEAFRYVRDPIQVRPDDYVRFYFLNVGPNLTSTFHAVGGVWDYIYYGGVPANRMEGTQSVVAGPTDSYVIEWQVPDEGPFTLVSHAFGTQAIKGAVGIMESSADAERDEFVRSEGPDDPPYEDPKRHVSPFGLGSMDLDRPELFRQGDDVVIEMVGNSFVPKRAHVPVGTTVTFQNEDVFDMLEGELTGKHDAVVVEAEGDEGFSTQLLDHAEREAVTFNEPGRYEYICSIHPYMRGEITVYEGEPDLNPSEDIDTVNPDADVQQKLGPKLMSYAPGSATATLASSIEADGSLKADFGKVMSYDEAMNLRGDMRESFGLDRDGPTVSDMQFCEDH